MKFFRIIVALFLVVTNVTGYADWQFGEHRLVRNYERGANTLNVRPSGQGGLRSIGLVTRVGGVNFEAVAEIDALVSISYLPDRTDGSRLRVKIGAETAYVELPDWQLVPIANYSDSEFTAVVSLFGDGPKQDDYFYIDYHPAFEDTLLGLRLLQADMMLMDPISFSKLPTYEGNTVLGHLENSEYDLDIDSMATVLSHLSGFEYQAWILTDIDESATASISQSELTITLNPYYYFWIIDSSSGESLLEDYEITYSAYENALNERKYQEADALEKRLNQLEAQIENYEPTVKPIYQLTNLLKSSENHMANLNPVVHESVNRTARVSALFRAVKSSNPNNWSNFLSSLSNVAVENIETPNQWAK